MIFFFAIAFLLLVAIMSTMLFLHTAANCAGSHVYHVAVEAMCCHSWIRYTPSLEFLFIVSVVSVSPSY